MLRLIMYIADCRAACCRQAINAIMLQNQKSVPWRVVANFLILVCCTFCVLYFMCFYGILIMFLYTKSIRLDKMMLITAIISVRMVDHAASMLNTAIISVRVV